MGARSFLDGNELQGGLPRTWASKGAFRTLYILCAPSLLCHAHASNTSASWGSAMCSWTLCLCLPGGKV